MSNHTPGPWKIQGDCVTFDQDGQCAQLAGHNSQANAILIATSPRILAALKRWEQFAQDNQWSESDCTFLAETRAAIAAAEPQPATV